MKKRLQTGFAHLGLLLLVLVAAVVVFAGYKVVKNRSNSTIGSASQPVTSQTAQPIKSAADLSSTETTLNSQNVDGDVNPDSLNQDVQALY